MRVAVACMMQETNTFNPLYTTREYFAHASGEAVYSHPRWCTGDDATRGILDTLAEHGATVIPLTFFRALPGGPVDSDTYKSIISETLSALECAGPVDAVCIALHGSMYSSVDNDPEGTLLGRMRALTGFEIPICAAFDMHAKLSARLLENIDGLVGYKTAPHVDEYATGQHAANMVVEALKRSQRPQTIVERVPLLIAGEKSETSVPPMSVIIGELKKTEGTFRHLGVSAASVLLGFPWADTPHAGVSIAVTYWPDALKIARGEAVRIADMVWAFQSDFNFTTETRCLEDAIKVALEFIASDRPELPVIISDSGDNPTAGALQNMSVVLEHAVKERLPSALISAIADPDAYSIARSWFEVHQSDAILHGLRIGTVSHTSSQPFVWDCKVHAVHDLDRVSVVVLESQGITCLVTDRRVATYEPSLIMDCDIDPATFRVLFVKCGYQGPEYRSIASRSIVALTPGDSNEDLTALPYRNTPRPIVPLDNIPGRRPVSPVTS